ncbi:TPA: acetyl-CoA synthetase [Candidatus Micrarchaeota archaeon]|nr:acetyl-CoA synthetase [Candidatus Micrarchaeota archaeon]HIH29888.1 acetyl-CoA synthetase [Candidatus Micrarchaeota archaeon]
MIDFSLLSKYGIAVAPYKLVRKPHEAISASAEIGFPVAMKIVSPDALHKTDKGGVVVGIGSSHEAEKAYGTLMERFKGVKTEGVLVQKMVGKGAVELIIGGKKDPQFGQLIMLGMGGIFVEVYKDVTFRVCPITAEDAAEMISELRSHSILEGARGRKPVNKAALINALISASKLLQGENPSEFDINPLMADEKGCVAVDMRILY